METWSHIRARGDSDFTADDFDSMPYLLAVGKVRPQRRIYLLAGVEPSQEVLRVYPVAIDVPRMPNKDDVLPLSKPFVGVSGKVYNELPVPAGTILYISNFGYNLYVPSSCTLQRGS
jgi:hypothetical protein